MHLRKRILFIVDVHRMIDAKAAICQEPLEPTKAKSFAARAPCIPATAQPLAAAP
jgi:hypothetical protein